MKGVMNELEVCYMVMTVLEKWTHNCQFVSIEYGLDGIPVRGVSWMLCLFGISVFLAFFSSFVFLILSLISRRAASLAASRTSGFSALFFWMTSRIAPTIDLEYGFLVARRLFFTASWAMSFLCCFLRITANKSDASSWVDLCTTESAEFSLENHCCFSAGGCFCYLRSLKKGRFI